MFKKIVSVVMSVVLICGIFVTVPINASAATQQQAVAWCTGKLGKFVEYSDSRYMNQCFDFISAYADAVFGYPSFGNGVLYAKDLINYNPGNGWALIRGSSNLKIGDIFISSAAQAGNTAGHTGVIIDVSGTNITVIDQNNGKRSDEGYTNRAVGTHHMTPSEISGVLRPPLGSPPPAPSGFTNVSDNSEFSAGKIVYLQSSATGNFVITNKDSARADLCAVPVSQKNGELFTIGKTADGWLTFRAQSNKKYVTADRWSDSKAPLVAAASSVGMGECFMICKKNNGEGYYIFSQKDPKTAGKCLSMPIMKLLGVIFPIQASPIYAYGDGSSPNDKFNIISSGQVAYNGGGGIGDVNLPAKIPVPPTPASASISSANQCIGATANATWSSSNYASSYLVSLICTTNSAYSQPAKEMGGTGTYYVLNNPGTYKISVRAKNSSGESGARESGTIIIHPNKTVTFKDHDGKVLQTQSVPYGGVACPPVAPSREGWTFQGWNAGFDNITADRTITANYKINRHTVRFVGHRGEILKTETVDWGTAATPPSVTPPEGYHFISWDSKDYELVKSDTTITAVYAWTNPDLPNIVKIQSATRNQNASGYNVAVSLQNAPLGLVRGRVIVALKTKTGKMVASATETYYLNELAEAGKNVYVPYSGVATTAEVSVVGLLDDENTGVPLARMASKEIDLGLTWSDWVLTLPVTGDYETESRIEYRYKDKQTTTRNTPSLDGWTLVSSARTGWGNWSAWTTTPYGSSSEREVQTQIIAAQYKTQWHYDRYMSNDGKTAAPVWQNITPNYQETPWLDYSLTWKGNSNMAGYSYYGSYAGSFGTWMQDRWYNPRTRQAEIVAGRTEWRYRDSIWSYTFEKWNDWSDWLTGTVPTATASKQVETRTTHRYKADESKLNENTAGVERTVSGTIGTPGKLVTLLVFRKTNVDPTASQLQYIAQTTVDENGQYSFTYTTKDEPDEKTGDFIVMVAPEGGTAPIFVDTIKAPKPKYSVLFQNHDGTEISTQMVEEGEDAILPSQPIRTGHNFIGWDQSTVNIRKDITITATYEKKKYQVAFVDWDHNGIEFKEFEHGDILYTDNIPFKEGSSFECWVSAENQEVTTVTANMVVSAKYTLNQYAVTFLDWDGNVISEQTVTYGEAAALPEIGNPSDENMIFAEWSDMYALDHVADDTTVSPKAMYKESVEEPIFSVEPGEYSSTQSIRLTCATPDAKIFFTTDGTIPAYELTDQGTIINGIQYYSPMAIEEDTVVIAAAFVPEKNDSPLAVGIYYIEPSIVDVKGISLNKTTASLKKGETLKLAATISPTDATNKAVTWTTSSSSIATVENGLVTAKSSGTATITAKASGGKTATCKVTVAADAPASISVTGIKLSSSAMDMIAGNAVTLQATISPSNATDKTVTWTSSNTSIATVSGGKVTAKSPGTATITAKSSNGKTATSKITVHRYVSMRIGKSAAIQNGQMTTIDSNGSTPLKINGKTMLPIRFISEKMGAKVKYVNDKTPIVITYGDKKIELKLGSKEMKITQGGKTQTIKIDAAAQKIGGRTYLPLRAIGQAMDFDVYYKADGSAEYVVVNNPKMTAAVKNARLNEAKEYIK